MTAPAGPGADRPRCGVGTSTDERLDVALASAADAARATLGAGGGGVVDLAVVFVSAAYGPQVRPALEQLCEQVTARVLIGRTAR